jgi:hypothetical protein
VVLLVARTLVCSVGFSRRLHDWHIATRSLACRLLSPRFCKRKCSHLPAWRLGIHPEPPCVSMRVDVRDVYRFASSEVAAELASILLLSIGLAPLQPTRPPWPYSMRHRLYPYCRRHCRPRLPRQISVIFLSGAKILPRHLRPFLLTPFDLSVEGYVPIIPRVCHRNSYRARQAR